MLKKILKTKKQNVRNDAKEMLTLELAEIQEISEKLFSRLDKKIKTIHDAEARLDRKIETLEKLIHVAENIKQPVLNLEDVRRRDINTLSKRGLKIDEIASMLDMPKGEVELILSLNR